MFILFCSIAFFMFLFNYGCKQEYFAREQPNQMYKQYRSIQAAQDNSNNHCSHILKKLYADTWYNLPVSFSFLVL